MNAFAKHYTGFNPNIKVKVVKSNKRVVYTQKQLDFMRKQQLEFEAMVRAARIKAGKPV